jgi:hypothetical protein
MANLTPDEQVVLNALRVVVRGAKPHDVQAITTQVKRATGALSWTNSTTKRHLARLQDRQVVELTDGGWAIRGGDE